MVIRVPKFRAVTSGLLSFDAVYKTFGQWQKSHNHLFESVVFNSPDFLMGKDGLFEWVWGIKAELTEADTEPYKIIEFKGGLYAVTVSVDGEDESHLKVRAKMDKWLATTNFIEDTNRLKAGHMIYVDDEIKAGLGYHQMNLYLPIKVKA